MLRKFAYMGFTIYIRNTTYCSRYKQSEAVCRIRWTHLRSLFYKVRGESRLQPWVSAVHHYVRRPFRDSKVCPMLIVCRWLRSSANSCHYKERTWLHRIIKWYRYIYLRLYGVYSFYPLMYQNLFILGMVG